MTRTKTDRLLSVFRVDLERSALCRLRVDIFDNLQSVAPRVDESILKMTTITSILEMTIFDSMTLSSWL